MYGWVDDYWVEPGWHFTYPGFDWVQPLPGPVLKGIMVGMHVLGWMIALGVFSRVAVFLVGVGWTYFFLLDQMTYLNHMYLICVLCGLMAISPAHRTFSLQAWFTGREVGAAPWWSATLVRNYVAVVYFFAGVAKINPDWLQAQPMIMWMERRRDMAVVGDLLAHDGMAWFLSYGGLLFDLAVGPMLLFRRTRIWILPAVIAFHLTNATVFHIGVFPWMMLGACVLFLEPETIRGFLSRRWRTLALPAPAAPPAGPTARRVGLAFLVAFFGVQLALPFRHLRYPGSPSWTEEGHLFAWHMKLRSKSARLSYLVVDPVGKRRWTVDPQEHLSKRQARKIKTRPDLIWLFAQRIAEEEAALGNTEVRVFARSFAGLNGRPKQPFIDPDVDLARADRHVFSHAPWILPMDDVAPGAAKGAGVDE
jgi:hypothetical protein